MHLGTLVSSSISGGPAAPENFHAVTRLGDTVNIDDKTVADKAVEDSKTTPSLWFVNFPTKDAATAGSKQLAAYMQNVIDYRCWASGRWWRTVYANNKVPQDGSKASTDARSAYCAKVAITDMKTTPWLAMDVDHNVSKQIRAYSRQFHTELVTNVLKGFIDVTPNILKTLEAILQSISSTVENSAGTKDTKTIVCEKYEYLPEADVIASYVRVISFSVSQDMRNVVNAKKTEQEVTCDIEYNEYSARFNQKEWAVAAEDIDASQKKATQDFVKKQTVDCDP
ncbi:hypothetical protein M406DRAFT_358068 [Cryphonectria parasitica EP155]|uniref:Uncharacterized protein n=1 Tax=Cryphonectria parasitica (strain ATCC 38755 / EP155) TaxID=660469 RepID=A0A9P4XUT0_CRYP1|nr:uncharacterized protein M406DRAFT_358068 [Cryphonectria parasitica EP155]KAF3761664.1 hypothetical protein M406DRAFT_358068 [Cryphonectria parasitica EP155]